MQGGQRRFDIASLLGRTIPTSTSVTWAEWDAVKSGAVAVQRSVAASQINKKK
jgi:hypothetical protein